MLLFHIAFPISVLRNVFQFNPRIKQNLNLHAAGLFSSLLGNPN